MPSLRTPDDAADELARRLTVGAAARAVAEARGAAIEPIEIPLRPGIRSSAHVHAAGLEAWQAWRSAWADGATALTRAGGRIVTAAIRVSGVASEAPLILSLESSSEMLAVLRATGHDETAAALTRARRIAGLLAAHGCEVNLAAVRAVGRLTDDDISTLFNAVVWLAANPDLSRWTLRQLQIPSADTKWLESVSRRALLQRLTGRDVAAEVRPRLTFVHLTYADRAYRRSGGRHHDAWTAQDRHEPAYLPRTVVIVENRDCRLWFPPLDGAIIVEGEGKAAGVLAGIPWIRDADRIFYWGDIDADGFAILDNLRGALHEAGAEVESVLMDGAAHARYRHLGGSRDRHGALLGPASAPLPWLTAGERDAYAAIGTTGSVDVRRIEQERLPGDHAKREIERMLLS